MTKAELNKSLGRKMWVRLFNGRELKGYLAKGGGERFKNVWGHDDENEYFFVDEHGQVSPHLFRASHIMNYRFL